MAFRYDVCLEEYMDLSPRLRSGTTSKDTKPKRQQGVVGVKRKLNNNFTYSSIQQNIELATTLLLQKIYVFTILEAPYI